MERLSQSIDELRHRQRLRLLRKARHRAVPGPRARLIRAALAVLFLGAVFWTHRHFGETGVVLLALLVLLGLSHPLWLLLPPGNGRRRAAPDRGKASNDPTRVTLR
jgi:hypothetical protein